jgi:hypothetical protein
VTNEYAGATLFLPSRITLEEGARPYGWPELPERTTQATAEPQEAKGAQSSSSAKCARALARAQGKGPSCRQRRQSRGGCGKAAAGGEAASRTARCVSLARTAGAHPPQGAKGVQASSGSPRERTQKQAKREQIAAGKPRLKYRITA